MAQREKIEIGRKYGGLTVIDEAGRAKNRAKLWLCQCECGEYAEKTKAYLLDAKYPQCMNCSQKKTMYIKPGDTYNNLTALRQSENDREKWWFHCNLCGTDKEIYFRHVYKGNIKSCGCIQHINRVDEDEVPEPKKKAVKPYRIGDQFEYMTIHEIEAAERAPKMGDINDDAVEAKKRGMSYGQYMGLKILEEIKRKKESYVQ